MKACIYTRVSTDKQEKEGYSLKEQERLCKDMISMKEWEYTKTYTDTFTGKTLDRPGLKEMLSDLKERAFDIIVVYKLDRLSRSQGGTMEIIEKYIEPNDIGLVSLKETLDTTTPWGRAMIGILAAFNQLDRETISQRMRMGKKAKLDQGLFTGCTVPYGYRTEKGVLYTIPEEATVVRIIFRCKRDGMTTNQIVEELNDNGFRRRDGKLFNNYQVDDIKYNTELYLGEWHFNGGIIKVPPILTLDDIPTKWKKRLVSRQTLEELGVVDV